MNEWVTTAICMSCGGTPKNLVQTFSSVSFYICTKRGGGQRLLCSHINSSRVSEDFLPAGQVEKVCRNFTFTHTPPLEKLWSMQSSLLERVSVCVCEREKGSICVCVWELCVTGSVSVLVSTQSQLTCHCICHHACRCGCRVGHDRWSLRWQNTKTSWLLQNQDTTMPPLTLVTNRFRNMSWWNNSFNTSFPLAPMWSPRRAVTWQSLLKLGLAQETCAFHCFILNSVFACTSLMFSYPQF